MSDVKEMTLQEEYDLYKVIKEKQVLDLQKRIDNLLEAVESTSDLHNVCQGSICECVVCEALEQDKQLKETM